MEFSHLKRRTIESLFRYGERSSWGCEDLLPKEVIEKYIIEEEGDTACGARWNSSRYCPVGTVGVLLGGWFEIYQTV